MATLAAGGLVPVTAAGSSQPGEPGSGGPSEHAAPDTDVVAARAYRHAALPGRTVVRLSAENVTAGDELEMATLGFAPGEDLGAVARERRRPLGFPGRSRAASPRSRTRWSRS